MATSARLDELKKKFDENPRRYFAPLANEYRKQGDAAQAIALCRTHLPNQPGHISGHIVLAQALYESRELGESRQIFEAALDLDPENLIALRYLGDIAREQGSPAAAQAWYRRVLEFDPRNEEIAQLLADVRNDAEVAIADLATRPTPPASERTEFVTEFPHEMQDVASPDAEPIEAAFAPPIEDLQSSEPLELYSTDPTGDAWREALTPGDGSASESPEIELGVTGENATDASESLDDWFAAAPAAPAVPPQVASDEFTIDPPEPVREVDVGDLAPVTDTYSSDESAHGEDTPAAIDATEPGPGAASETPDDSLMEFSPWDAATAEMASNAPSIGELDNDLLMGAAAEPAQPQEDVSSEAIAGTAEEFADSNDEEHPVADGAEVALAWNDAAPTAEESPEPLAEEWRTTGADALEATIGEEASEIDSAFAGPHEAPPALEVDGPPIESPADLTTGYESRDSQDAAMPVESAPDDPWQASASSDGDYAVMPDTVREPEAFATEAMDPVEAHHEELQPDPMIGRTPSFVPVVSEESPAPFVTETMAELYLQQGFRTEALSVYRQLLARNPGDPQLTARVQALESGAEWSIAPDEAAPPPTPASESARAFFARFATREPTRRVTGSAAAEADTSPAPAFPLGGAALPDEALTTPDAPALTQIFSGQQEDPADTRAASALASAFDPSPAPGGELSLERLFRDVPARSSSAVTLTEEESATLAEPGGGAPPPAESPDETPADYEQFTAWLEGLKKK